MRIPNMIVQGLRKREARTSARSEVLSPISAVKTRKNELRMASIKPSYSAMTTRSIAGRFQAIQEHCVYASTRQKVPETGSLAGGGSGAARGGPRRPDPYQENRDLRHGCAHLSVG